eukprot:gene11510-biopygen15424
MQKQLEWTCFLLSAGLLGATVSVQLYAVVAHETLNADVASGKQGTFSGMFVSPGGNGGAMADACGGVSKEVDQYAGTRAETHLQTAGLASLHPSAFVLFFARPNHQPGHGRHSSASSDAVAWRASGARLRSAGRLVATGGGEGECGWVWGHEHLAGQLRAHRWAGSTLTLQQQQQGGGSAQCKG